MILVKQLTRRFEGYPTEHHPNPPRAKPWSARTGAVPRRPEPVPPLKRRTPSTEGARKGGVGGTKPLAEPAFGCAKPGGLVLTVPIRLPVATRCTRLVDITAKEGEARENHEMGCWRRPTVRPGGLPNANEHYSRVTDPKGCARQRRGQRATRCDRYGFFGVARHFAGDVCVIGGTVLPMERLTGRVPHRRKSLTHRSPKPPCNASWGAGTGRCPCGCCTRSDPGQGHGGWPRFLEQPSRFMPEPPSCVPVGRTVMGNAPRAATVWNGEKNPRSSIPVIAWLDGPNRATGCRPRRRVVHGGLRLAKTCPSVS